MCQFTAPCDESFPTLPLYKAVQHQGPSLTEQLVQSLVEPVGLGRWHIIAGVLLDLSQISDEVSFVCFDRLCLLDELPAKEDNGEEEHHHVAEKC